MKSLLALFVPLAFASSALASQSYDCGTSLFVVDETMNVVAQVEDLDGVKTITIRDRASLEEGTIFAFPVVGEKSSAKLTRVDGEIDFAELGKAKASLLIPAQLPGKGKFVIRKSAVMEAETLELDCVAK